MRLASLEAVARSLNAAQVPFLVAGGLAVIAHGYGRTTQDVDLVIHLEQGVIARCFAALASLGYRPSVPVTSDEFVDPQRRARMVAEKGMTVLNFQSDEHRETPIDIFASEPFDFAREHESALVEEVAPGVPLRFVRLATLLRMKREAGRPQDIADVAELERLNRGA